MEVRLATCDDVPVLSGMLVRAFDDDPVTRWTYGDGEARPRWSRRFFVWQLRRLMPQQSVWTTRSGEAAALWARPGCWRESGLEALRLLWATAPGLAPRARRVLRGLGQVEKRHPEERHLYLAVLGVEPGRQGCGLGSAVVRPGLELCDRDGLPAYVETSRERSVAFYARHGFAVTDEVRLPAGPPVWLMWRDPA
jgi:ribosomal protein S18 acetylase RimI-like enzyme